jgi:thioredoxin reductase (NADPH)
MANDKWQMTHSESGIVVYGVTWCLDCKRAKQFLGEQRIPYHWVNIEEDAAALDYVEELNAGKRTIPTIVFPDGSFLAEPTNAQLAEKLGLPTRALRDFYDVIVIGAGPTGLTAALYLAREKADTLVIERSMPGGQASVTQYLENVPGFDEGISGEDFGRRLANQARRFGVEILQTQAVKNVQSKGAYREVVTTDGTDYGAKAVLVATGSRYRRLNVPGESQLIGVNIHFCATCDGAFYRGKDVLVVGGGNSGFQEGLFLTRFASHVTIVEFAPQVKASTVLQDKVAERQDMTVIANHAVQEFVVRDGQLAAVKVQDRATGEVTEWHPAGVFVFAGLSPNSEFLSPEIERDRFGFVTTDLTLHTSVKGIFAAGDVRAGSTKQIASAAGEGATAALMIREYLREQ